MEIFLSRQPIFSHDERIVGYGVAHRLNSAEPSVPSAAYDVAENVLVDALLGAGLVRIGEGRPIFLKASRELLASQVTKLVAPGDIVFEIDAEAMVDEEIVSTLRALHAAGHKFALDNFCADAPGALVLGFAHVVKIDVTALGRAETARAVAATQAKKHALLAVNARDRAERDRCMALGFRYFQGYRFTRPETVVKRDLDVNLVAIFRVLRDLLDQRISDREIEVAFERDVTLTFRLLKIVNSAAMAGGGVWSVGHAMRLLGRTALHRWLSLCLLASSEGDGVEAELARTALVRASMCEALATECGVKRAAPSLFLVGLFSMLDVMTGVPMEDLMMQINPAADVRDALLTRGDFFGAALALVEAWEAADWAGVMHRAAEVGVDPKVLPNLYVDALDWAKAHVQQELAA
jgi:EAL and modified HD-GYP domain-containing signal transduction protein